MAVVIDIANKLVKRTEQVGASKDKDTNQASEDLIVIDYLDSVKEWKDFVDGELDASNKKNKRTLGGSTRPSAEEDTNDDENGYDVQMDKIMARFNNFNRILSQSSNNDDDDEEEDEDNT